MARVVRRGERPCDTREEALASLRDAVQMVLDKDSMPPELAETLDLEVA
jgi:hypothetical protein